MSDSISPVTGAASIVGFAHNDHDRHYNNDVHHYHQQDYGISDKDQGYQAAVDAGERTRDILHGQRFSDKVVTDGVSANHVAVEKTGAAAVLATEKTAAAILNNNDRNFNLIQVQAERIRADELLQSERSRTELATQAERYQLANTLALSDLRLEQQKQACVIEAKIAECCCETKALILSVESNRVRDDLAQCRAELLAAKK